MENQAQDSALLHATLEAAVDAMVVADQSGRMLRANSAACRMFGYECNELIGENVNMLMAEPMAAMHDGFIAHHHSTGEKRVIGSGRDVEGQRKDQSVFPLHLSVGCADLDGQPMFIGILHDLTTRNATLDALARSQRLDAIGQMTGGIAHDFNNLLTVITGNLELLEMRGVTDRQKPLLKDAMAAAELGADLTARLLVFGRQSNLKPVKADLRECCQDTLYILKRTLGAGFQIRTDFPSEPTPVMIDPVQLQSALMNLAFNARDSMVDKGELLISIANVTIDDSYIAQETDIEPGDYVRLSVSDNGAGMGEEVQKKAFEPFFTTKSKSGGTGLGLSMVYGFVRQSGGHITLYSELNLGTSFGLYFPAIAELNAEMDGSGSGNEASARTPRGNGETVLVVEDDPKVRKLSIKRIRDLGFHTLEAENGDAACKILTNGAHVDVVFSDLVMPGRLNGFDLAAKVTADFPDIKVLLTSGYASDAVTGSMKAHGQHYDILHKPFRQFDLALRLQALLTGSPGD